MGSGRRGDRGPVHDDRSGNRSYLGEAGKYREGIEGILRGDLEKADQFVSALEARAMKIEAMREAADELGKLESYEKDIRNQIDEMRYKADLQSQYEKHVKGKDAGSLLTEAMMKGKELGGDHFEGNEDLLASAQEAFLSLARWLPSLTDRGGSCITCPVTQARPRTCMRNGPTLFVG